jgi:hypothetical protein
MTRVYLYNSEQYTSFSIKYFKDESNKKYNVYSFSFEGKACKSKISFVMKPLQNPTLCTCIAAPFESETFTHPPSTLIYLCILPYLELHQDPKICCEYM